MTGVTKGTEEAAANTNPNTEGTELYIKKENDSGRHGYGGAYIDTEKE